MSSWPTKDPNEVLDYVIEWRDADDPCLEVGETIASSVWSVVEGTVTLDDEEINGSQTLIWVTGGVNGEVAKILDRITTSEGRIYDKTVTLRIRSS